jgi:hypothetical protein
MHYRVPPLKCVPANSLKALKRFQWRWQMPLLFGTNAGAGLASSFETLHYAFT